MLTLRRWHAYIGLFTAPSVLFFALTGALQVFSLHEAHGNYHPPVVVEKLSSVHKDQVFELGHHGQAPPGVPEPGVGPPPDGGPPDDHDHDKPAAATLLLKGFFLLVALALSLSTLVGLYIGLTRGTQRRVGWLLVVGGSLLPVGLLLMQ